MANFLKQLLGLGSSRSVNPQETVGTRGTDIVGGYVEVREKNPKLVGTQKYKTYSDILANTAIVAAGVRFFLNLVSKSDWKVIPADDSAKAEEIAEFYRNMIHDMETPWHRVIRRAAMYRFYGFSIHEWTAKKTDDGKIGLLDIAPRPQVTIERWDVDSKGNVLGVTQRIPQTAQEEYLPRGKILYLVDDSLNDSPEGLGLFRHIVDSCHRLKRYEDLELFGFETDLRGIPVAKAPLGVLNKLKEEGAITQEDYDKILQPVMKFLTGHIKSTELSLLLDSAPYYAQDEGRTPSGVQQWELELLQSSGSGLPEIAKAIDRLNQEAARVLGVEHLLLGSTSAGSFALSKEKSHNFGLIVESTLTELEHTANKDIIGPVHKLNGWPEELKPRFQTEAAQFRDITEITTALKDLSTAGAPLSEDDEAINEVRELLGISPIDLEAVRVRMEEDAMVREQMAQDMANPAEEIDDDADSND